MNTRKFPKINTLLECNTEKTFQGDFSLLKNRTVKIGHILSMSFPFVRAVLKPDFELSNPENPEIKDPVVAVVEYFDRTHCIAELNFKVSA